jgi:CRP-like cAMP-binding protein
MLTVMPRFAERGSSTNRLLSALPVNDSSVMLATLEAVELPMRAILHEPNVAMTHVYFPDRGTAASLVAPLDADHGVEVGTVGDEGLVGLPLVFGIDSEPFLAVTVVPGSGWRTSASRFRRGLDDSAALRDICARYAQSFILQVAQGSACNRAHSIEQRCARWLLMTHDRADGKGFTVTQDLLAIMLGVRRAGVTVAAGALRHAGLISYHRGQIVVVDREGLEAASCSCYRVIRDGYDAVMTAPRSSDVGAVAASIRG